MDQHKKEAKRPVQWGSIMIRAAAVLLFLTMLSCHLLSGLFARYTASDLDRDRARVAGFDVKITGPAYVTCEVTALYPGQVELTIKNDSEVAVSYGIRVELEDSAGCGVLVKLDAGSAAPLTFEGPGIQVQKFDFTGSLAVGAETAAHTLSFEPLHWTTITEHVYGESATLTQSFTVYVDVVQID